MTSPLTGAAIVADVPARAMPNAASVGIKIARMFLSSVFERRWARLPALASAIAPRRSALALGSRPGTHIATSNAIAGEPSRGNQNGTWPTHSLLVHFLPQH